MEQNKTGKYLKYAVGEIVLVVIGILIALSINNWNEDRKEQSKQILLVTQILQDAKADSVFYYNRFNALRWVESTIHAANLLGKGKPVDSSMFRTHGKGRIFTMNSILYTSAVLDNNPDAYDKIISPDIKSKLRVL